MRSVVHRMAFPFIYALKSSSACTSFSLLSFLFCDGCRVIEFDRVAIILKNPQASPVQTEWELWSGSGKKQEALFE